MVKGGQVPINFGYHVCTKGVIHNYANDGRPGAV